MSDPKVMVALGDVESVDSLIQLACQLSKGMECEVVALHVVEVTESLPLDAESEVLDQPGKEILARARETAAKCFSAEITTSLVRARDAGEAIAGEAADSHIDLLVMGHRRKSPLGEILLGSTAQHVARHASCRVIIQIPRRAEQN